MSQDVSNGIEIVIVVIRISDIPEHCTTKHWIVTKALKDDLSISGIQVIRSMCRQDSIGSARETNKELWPVLCRYIVCNPRGPLVETDIGTVAVWSGDTRSC